MKLTGIKLALTFVYAIPALALGAPLNIPYQFSAGTPAKAAEVNQNFSAVKSSVDDNALEVSSLKARIVALEAMPPDSSEKSLKVRHKSTNTLLADVISYDFLSGTAVAITPQNYLIYFGVPTVNPYPTLRFSGSACSGAAYLDYSSGAFPGSSSPAFSVVTGVVFLGKHVIPVQPAIEMTDSEKAAATYSSWMAFGQGGALVQGHCYEASPGATLAGFGPVYKEVPNDPSTTGFPDIFVESDYKITFD